MKIKRFLLIILSRAIRGAGMGMGVSGILFSVWFFSFHLMKVNIYGVYFQLVIFFVGYVMYRFAYTYIYDEWNDGY
ncbi:hypothetical protein [Scandinavium lactucae]|uniref:Uncharacterized protein n=1 Tax=Scandinavium lactucae TaxID=3095028 RepID=A0ABU4QIP6_9ENTR|nr:MULTISPECIES: hypothetical protein [unclassified Scandinavium]MDX6039166.1 hypothetical protein [Scandinavium sp. V105_6]MDX6050237.1 hypothetical protein [Scandinavium sp. V105_1]